jgi:signal transduction histidine kinase/ActR/RegA family two-component response regulator
MSEPSPADTSSTRDVQLERQRAARLQLLADVGRRTTAILSREELLHSAVRIVMETFDYFMVNIFLVDGRDLLLAAGSRPAIFDRLPEVRMPIDGKGITTWVARHARPLLVPDVRLDERYFYTSDLELIVRSELSVPMVLKGAVIGVLDAQSAEVGAYTDLDVFTLQAVADQLAVAIENARLYDELRRELGHRRRMEGLISSLHAAGLAMDRASSPEELFAVARGELARLGMSCVVRMAEEAGLGEAARSPGEEEALRLIRDGAPASLSGDTFVAALEFDDRLLGHLTVRSPDLDEEAVPALRVFADRIAAAWRKGQLMRDLEESLSRLRRTQEQLLQSQKMEAVGRLAGGVAHDFNNQLTAIIGYADLLADETPPDDPRQEGIGEIAKAARRAAELTRQLLAFSRKQILQARLFDANALVADMRGMLGRLLGEDVRIETRLATEPLWVRADDLQLQHVIVNLAVNARDAMRDGGRLSIETSRLVVAGPAPRDMPLLPVGAWCVLSVTDTGSGMDEQTLSRLFEPFFTTKGPGKGTGLGLSTAYGIVKQSGGYIFCRSAPGKGATFSICLPVVAAAPKARAEHVEPVPAAGGRERVLLIEDEAPVRELVRKTLAAAGYDVRAAASGDEGLSLLEGADPAPDLVITDMVLPGGVSGLDIARRVLSSADGTRLLCISGFSAQLAAGGAETLPPSSFLQKPFRPSELRARVRAILDAERPL